MAIRKSKIKIESEERSDFDNMMNDVENEVEEQQAEDGLVNRVPELKQLSAVSYTHLTLPTTSSV